MKHEWIQLESEWAKWLCCRKCGVVKGPKNADNDCNGFVKVRVREAGKND